MATTKKISSQTLKPNTKAAPKKSTPIKKPAAKKSASVVTLKPGEDIASKSKGLTFAPIIPEPPKPKQPITVARIMDPLGTQSMMQRLPDATPFLDPDSTRFIDWMAAYRIQQGKSTWSDFTLLPEEFQTDKKLRVSTKELAEQLDKGLFSHVFYAKDTFRGYRFNEVGQIDFFVLIGLSGSSRLIICAAGDDDEVEQTIQFFKKKYSIPKSITINRLINFGANGPEIRSQKLREENMRMAHDSFYPWLEGGLDKFFEDYGKSQASSILLIGPPGTGKTTFLRTLIFRMGFTTVGAVNNDNAINHPGLISWLESQEQGSFVFAEDADNLVRPRKDDNTQMNGLLSFADGVAPNDVKIAISTNVESLKYVDSALLRVGRNYRVLEFRLLNPDEANAARAALGLPAIGNYGNKTGISLAEALNWEETTPSLVHASSSIGFR